MKRLFNSEIFWRIILGTFFSWVLIFGNLLYVLIGWKLYIDLTISVTKFILNIGAWLIVMIMLSQLKIDG